MLQDLICCAFEMHNVLNMSGYFTYCCLLAASLISGINEAFLPGELLLTGIFHLFGPFSVNPEDACAGK